MKNTSIFYWFLVEYGNFPTWRSDIKYSQIVFHSIIGVIQIILHILAGVFAFLWVPVFFTHFKDPSLGAVPVWSFALFFFDSIAAVYLFSESVAFQRIVQWFKKINKSVEIKHVP